MSKVTVTISINVSADRKREGNNEFAITMELTQLREMNIKAFALPAEVTIENAIKEFFANNR